MVVGQSTRSLADEVLKSQTRFCLRCRSRVSLGHSKYPGLVLDQITRLGVTYKGDSIWLPGALLMSAAPFTIDSRFSVILNGIARTVTAVDRRVDVPTFAEYAPAAARHIPATFVTPH